MIKCLFSALLNQFFKNQTMRSCILFTDEHNRPNCQTQSPLTSPRSPAGWQSQDVLGGLGLHVGAGTGGQEGQQLCSFSIAQHLLQPQRCWWEQSRTSRTIVLWRHHHHPPDSDGVWFWRVLWSRGEDGVIWGHEVNGITGNQTKY